MSYAAGSLRGKGLGKYVERRPKRPDHADGAAEGIVVEYYF